MRIVSSCDLIEFSLLKVLIVDLAFSNSLICLEEYKSMTRVIRGWGRDALQMKTKHTTTCIIAIIIGLLLTTITGSVIAESTSTLEITNLSGNRISCLLYTSPSPR